MSGQLDFDSIPPSRHTDPATSRDAASRIATVRERHVDRARVALINAGPSGLTDFELEERTGVKQTSIGKRRKDLVDAGEVEMVEDLSGKPVKRPTSTGSLSQVWRYRARCGTGRTDRDHPGVDDHGV